MSESNEFGYYWSFELENVRCFGPKQTLELHRDGKVSKWVVLLGDNGVGKTTVLQCLYAMKPGAREIAALGHSIAAPIISGWTRWPSVPSARIQETLPRRDSRAKIEATIVPGTPMGHPSHAKISTSFEGDESVYATGCEPKVPFEMFVCGYGGSRKSSSSTDLEDEAATLFDEHATLVAAEKWFVDNDYAAARTESESARRRISTIRNTLINLLPDVDDLRVTGLDGDVPDATLEAHTPYGWVRVRDLSLGYRTLMAWVVDFAARMFARYPKSPNPLAEPAVCLVDEIDLHLHPAWQRKLIAYLDDRFPATQFIVTAHSPLVVQAAEHAKVAVLRRHEGEDFVTIHNDLESVRGWRIDQILTSDLFGLDGSRSPRLNALARERATILGKSTLDDADRARLGEMEREFEALPHGETAHDREAWDLVRRIAASRRTGEA